MNLDRVIKLHHWDALDEATRYRVAYLPAQRRRYLVTLIRQWNGAIVHVHRSGISAALGGQPIAVGRIPAGLSLRVAQQCATRLLRRTVRAEEGL